MEIIAKNMSILNKLLFCYVIIAFQVLEYINANTYYKVVMIYTTTAIADMGENLQN